MQQVGRRSQPRLVATSVSTLLTIVHHVGHIPFAIFLEYSRAVYLVVVIGRGYNEAIFIGCAHLVIDALHDVFADVIGKDHVKM